MTVASSLLRSERADDCQFLEIEQSFCYIFLVCHILLQRHQKHGFSLCFKCGLWTHKAVGSGWFPRCSGPQWVIPHPSGRAKPCGGVIRAPRSTPTTTFTSNPNQNPYGSNPTVGPDDPESVMTIRVGHGVHLIRALGPPHRRSRTLLVISIPVFHSVDRAIQVHKRTSVSTKQTRRSLICGRELCSGDSSCTQGPHWLRFPSVALPAVK